MTNIQRPTELEILHIAKWMNQIGHGHLEHIFEDIKKESSTINYYKSLVLKNNPDFDGFDVYKSNHDILGFIHYYDSSYLKINEPDLVEFGDPQIAFLKYISDNVLDNSMYIDSLFVKDEIRKKGIGAQLIKNAENEAKKQHYKTMYLTVFSNNDNAIAFYHHIGYEVWKTRSLNSFKFFSNQGLTEQIYFRKEI